MANEITTTIVSPVIVAVGGVITGSIIVTPPSAGNFYLLMKQYDADLVFIPGSQAYLDEAASGIFVNSTTLLTTLIRAAADVAETITIGLTLLNTDCYTYVYLMQRTGSAVAGAFVVGTTYEIMSIGTTDFTLIGAAANTIGLAFVATGVGAGTGTAAVPQAPDTDTEVDYVVITVQASSGTAGIDIDIAELMNLMITMMIVVMMMKMIAGSMKEIG